MSDIDNWRLFCLDKIAEIKKAPDQIQSDQEKGREYAELCACANFNNPIV